MSGLGRFPKSGEKLNYVTAATINLTLHSEKVNSKDTVLIERPYLRVANVQGGYVDLNDLATIQVTPDEDLKYRLHSGDVLMTEGDVTNLAEVVSGMVKLSLVCIRIMYLLSKPMKLFYFQSFWNI